MRIHGFEMGFYFLGIRFMALVPGSNPTHDPDKSRGYGPNAMSDGLNVLLLTAICEHFIVFILDIGQ
jgi:hypothetical protein